MRGRYLSSFISFCFFGYSWMVLPSRAATIVSCDESNLRNALTAGGIVTFACDGTIGLSNTVRITQDTVLDASGRFVTLSGEKRVRVLHVDPGATLTLVNLTVAFGQSTNGGGIYNDGGNVFLVNCVLATNSATGANSVITNGSDGLGGAVFNQGSLTISNSALRGNMARGGSGAFGNSGKDAQDIIDQYGRCRTVGVPSAGEPGSVGGQALGGGVFNLGTVVVARSTFEGNQAVGGEGGRGGRGGNGGCTGGCGPAYGGNGGAGGNAFGGGVYSSGAVTILDSTLANNEAAGGAGGIGGGAMCPFVTLPGLGGKGGAALAGAIWNSGFQRAANVTVAQNLARGGNGGFSGGFPPMGPCPILPNGEGGEANGGAIANEGTMTLLHATIWNNNAEGGSGTNRLATNCAAFSGSNGTARAASLFVGAGTLVLTNTIVGNLLSADNCLGPVIDGGHNICSDGSAGFSAGGSLNATDPRLGALADNGGPTLTLALQPGSPAIDAVDVAMCLGEDQRAVPRPSGAACDIGAFEGSGGVRNLDLLLSIAGSHFPTGQIAVLRAVISNFNTTSASNTSLTLSFPPSLRVMGWSNSCGGTGGLSSAGQFVVSGFSAGAAQSCVVEFSVAGSEPGQYTLVAEVASELTGLSSTTAFLIVTLTGRPTIAGGNVSGILADAATITGTVTPNGLPAEAWFEWGTTTNYGQQSFQYTVTAPGTTVSAVISGLAPGTTYHVRLVAQNANGLSHGEDRTFTTLSGIPEANTGLASAETVTGAVLSGSVTTRGLPGVAYFEYGPSTNYGQRTPLIDLPYPQRYTLAEAALTGLERGAVYYYRLVGASQLGTNHGKDELFGTLGAAGHLLRFSGLSGAIHGNTAFTNPGVFTLSLWFRTASTSGGTLATFTASLFSAFDPRDDRHLYLTGNGEVRFGVNDGAMRVIHGPPGYNDNRWHHAAAVLSSNGMKLYLDGNLAAADITVTRAHDHVGWWRLAFGYLANWPGTTGQPNFSGQLDEIHYWGIERSAAEIRHEMNWFLTGSEPGLMFYWACDEGAGNVLTDRSGHGRTANWFGSFPDLRWMVSTIPTRRLTPIVLGPWNTTHLAFPGTPGVLYALQASGDCSSWKAVKTNVAGLEGVVRFEAPMTGSAQFFRAVLP